MESEMRSGERGSEKREEREEMIRLFERDSFSEYSWSSFRQCLVSDHACRTEREQEKDD